ncbi:MAG TPA: helix-turn-helix transcriptional regulator [Solirubrobacteraceae bacterium]|nr:helix-turn-helix transcriptional regulator [Solirubrobacteraceae bacterium]
MAAINTTGAAVLGLLQLGPAPGAPPTSSDEGMSGWDLYVTATMSLGRFWNVTRSQIYRELQRLADDGLVEPAGGSVARERRPYRATAAGRTAFADWLAGWVREGAREEQLRSPLILTIFFGELVPPETLRLLLDDYRVQHQKRLAELRRMESVLGDVRRLPAFTLRRGIAYQEMMVRWLDELSEFLEAN